MLLDVFEVGLLAIYITITTTAPIESHRNPPSYSATACSNLTRAERIDMVIDELFFEKKIYPIAH